MKFQDFPGGMNIFSWVLREAQRHREERRTQNIASTQTRKAQYIQERKPVWDALDARLARRNDKKV